MVKLKDLFPLIQSLPISCEAYPVLVPFLSTKENLRDELLHPEMRDDFPSFDEFKTVYNTAAELDEIIYGRNDREKLPSAAEVTEWLEKYEAQENESVSWASYDGSDTEEAAYLYPFQSMNASSPDDLYTAMLLDAIFYAIDQAIYLRDGQGSPAVLRDLVGSFWENSVEAYDSSLFPCQNAWVFSSIKKGDTFKVLNQNRDKTHRYFTPIEKEIEYVSILLAQLQNSINKNALDTIILFFLLYEMNRGSRAFDCIVSSYCHNHHSLYPSLFSLLYPFHTGKHDRTSASFYDVCTAVCSLWAKHLAQLLYLSLKSFKDIIPLIGEIGKLPLIQSFFLHTGVASLIDHQWQAIQRPFLLESERMPSYDYYRLMANYAKNSRLTANYNDNVEKLANSLSTKIESTLKERLSSYSKENADLEENVEDDEDDFEKSAWELLKTRIQFFNSQIIEDEWRYNKGIGDDVLERNPFASMKFPSPAEGAKFGCPLHIFQKSISEIEAVLGDAIILTIFENLLIDSDIDLANQSDTTDTNIAKQRDLLLTQICRLHDGLSVVEHAFYELLMEHDLYPILINLKTHDGKPLAAGIIPSILEKSKDSLSDMRWKVAPSAQKDERLQYVYQQSPERWLSIMETLCKVSYGKNSLANSDEEFQCFKSKCSANQRWRCRKDFLEILTRKDAIGL